MGIKNIENLMDQPLKSDTLRLDVLKKSLEVENSLSQVIKAIIRVPKEDTKTLGNTNSALSFKTKADLLHDLGRLESKHYKLLILFMELRNQFVHNINAISFSTVFEFLGEDRRKHLIRIDPTIKVIYDAQAEGEAHEHIYQRAFQALYIELLEVLMQLYQGVIQIRDAERQERERVWALELGSEVHKLLEDSVEQVIRGYFTEMGEGFGANLDQNATALIDTIHALAIKKIKEKYPFLPD